MIEKALLCGYSTSVSVVLEFLLTCPERALGGILINGMSEVSDWMLRYKISLGCIFSKLGAVSTIAFPVPGRKKYTPWKTIEILQEID